MNNATDAGRDAADIVTFRCPAALVGDVVAALHHHGVLQYAMVEVCSSAASPPAPVQRPSDETSSGVEDGFFEVIADPDPEFELVEDVGSELDGLCPLEGMGGSLLESDDEDWDSLSLNVNAMDRLGLPLGGAIPPFVAPYCKQPLGMPPSPDELPRPPEVCGQKDAVPAPSFKLWVDMSSDDVKWDIESAYSADFV